MIYLGNTPVGAAIDMGVQRYMVQANNIFYYGQDTSVPKPTVPEKIFLDLPSCRSIQGMFSQYIQTDAYSLPITEVTIKLYNPVMVQNFARRNNKLKKIIFPNGITITSTYYDFINPSVVESIIGAIDFYNPLSYSTIANAFNGSSLKDIEFVPNCIMLDMSFDTTTVLTDESIVFIANGLNESVTGKTLTMASAVKTRMQNMNGNSAIPSGKSYHVFTPDANGSITLADFVTNVKGWSLA